MGVSPRFIFGNVSSERRISEKRLDSTVVVTFKILFCILYAVIYHLEILSSARINGRRGGPGTSQNSPRSSRERFVIRPITRSFQQSQGLAQVFLRWDDKARRWIISLKIPEKFTVSDSWRLVGTQLGRPWKTRVCDLRSTRPRKQERILLGYEHFVRFTSEAPLLAQVRSSVSRFQSIWPDDDREKRTGIEVLNSNTLYIEQRAVIASVSHRLDFQRSVGNGPVSLGLY